ncbi:hypothetical protein BW730_01025 [Tessaracoccus aquimaris]|uniref:Uncharacterized protein n=1 Tax=Tessaracoccus aquimaris TaxID=1332264 RepID=A0A1Q2CJY4_9ACTN|nr:hypothetical protein [Tessaracoccus aquimaris]AQP46355.1 hypothetical protein BW730_01025 [Tessaracoccus aquimaris]
MKAETPLSDSPSPEALAEFLNTAPEELRGWAEQQLAQANANAGPDSIPERADDSQEKAPAASDLALAELGEDDDEPRRTKVHTPMDKVPTPVPVAAQKKRSGLALPVIGLALLAALVYGIFRIGLPPQQDDQAAGQAPAPTSQPTDGGAARMAELEAKLVDAPDDVAINLELGVLHFNNGNQERAEELWTKVTEVDARNAQAWYNLGFIHLAEEPPNAAAAKAAWDTVLEVAPDSDLAATVVSHLDALDAMGSASPSPTPTGK